MIDSNKARLAYISTLMDLNGKVVKTADNEFFKNKYATLDNVQDVILPVLHKNDATLVQNITALDNGIEVITKIYHKDGDEMLFSPVFMPVNKNDAQGYGSVHTYGRRYALLTQFHIAPADDDGNAAAAAPPKAKQPPQPIETAMYPQHHFDKNIDKWLSIIAAGRKSADDIIGFVETKGKLTEEMIKQIKGEK